MSKHKTIACSDCGKKYVLLVQRGNDWICRECAHALFLEMKAKMDREMANRKQQVVV